MKKRNDFYKFGLTVQDVSLRIEQRVFSERDRRILKRIFIDDVTYEDLAEEFYLSTERIKKIAKYYKSTLLQP